MPGLFSGWRHSYLSYVFFFCLRPETGEVNGYVVEMGLGTVLVTFIVITRSRSMLNTAVHSPKWYMHLLSTKTRRPFYQPCF